MGKEFKTVDAETGEPTGLGAMEEAGVAFDPERMALDLTKDEKRRTTALLLAIQGYRDLIIKDADYLREMHAQARSGGGPKIQPATIDAMVVAAIKFDAFIAGKVTLAPDESEPHRPAEAEVAP